MFLQTEPPCYLARFPQLLQSTRLALPPQRTSRPSRLQQSKGPRRTTKRTSSGKPRSDNMPSCLRHHSRLLQRTVLALPPQETSPRSPRGKMREWHQRR